MLASVPFTGELTNKGYRKRLSLLKMKLLDVEYEEGTFSKFYVAKFNCVIT